MKVRKLGERGGNERPDRSNASWQKSADKKDSLDETIAPQQVPEPPPQQDSVAPKPKGVRRRGKRGSRKGIWNDESKRVETKTPIWLIGLLALFLLGCLGMLLVTSLRNHKDGASAVPASPPKKTIDDEIAEMDLGPVSEVMPHEVAMAFAMTADPQERLKHCRDPKRVAALIPEFPEQAVSVIGISGMPMGESNANNLEVQRFKVLLEEGEPRLIFVLRTDQGPKVDWEAYARHGQDLKRWFAEAQTTPLSTREEETAEVRVFAIRDNY